VKIFIFSKVQNRYGSCMFASEKAEFSKSWIEVIAKCKDELANKEAKKIQVKLFKKL
jgi:hypothetical protein